MEISLKTNNNSERFVQVEHGSKILFDSSADNPVEFNDTNLTQAEQDQMKALLHALSDSLVEINDNSR